MVAATLKLGIAILNGGNSTVQQVMSLSHPHNVLFKQTILSSHWTVLVIPEELLVVKFFIFCVKNVLIWWPSRRRIQTSRSYPAICVTNALEKSEVLSDGIIMWSLHFMWISQHEMVCFNTGKKWIFLPREPRLATRFIVLYHLFHTCLYWLLCEKEQFLNMELITVVSWVSFGEAEKGLSWWEERKASGNLRIFDLQLLWAPESRHWDKALNKFLEDLWF